MNIIPATTAGQLAVIESLARIIIPEFYDQLLPPAVGSYLVETYHTAAVLEKKMAEGDELFLLESDQVVIGFFALQYEGEGMTLGKFYISKDYRGRGFGQRVMSFVDQRARERGVGRVQLLVFRLNVGAVGLYRKNGYVVEQEVLTQLGSVHGLEDYLMVKLMGDDETDH
jgi:ribosomal protein S18 acetylase RimI-like enzyme